MKNSTYFIITLLFGWFGVHKFIKKKWGMGILYLCTFGLFGIGWAVDCICAFIQLSGQRKEQLTATLSQDEIVDNLCISLDPEFVSFVLPLIKSGIAWKRIEEAYRSSHPAIKCEDLFLKISYVANYYSNASALADISSCGASKYQIVSCDDESLCDVCKKFKGRTFPVSSAKIGYNCPPFHLGCRCLVVIEE